MRQWNEQRAMLAQAVAASESPAEASMLGALLWRSADGGPFLFGLDGYDRRWLVAPQHQAPPFRIDIAVPAAKVAIEVDGHEWHERTPAQVRADNERERSLISTGWTVLHFSGSEVWRDPNRCAGVVMEYLERVARRVAYVPTPSPNQDLLDELNRPSLGIERENELLRELQRRSRIRLGLEKDVA